MPREQALSPRHEALTAIEAVRAQRPDSVIDDDAWAKIIGLAWDARSEVGSRRDVQAAIREVLLSATRRAL